MKTSVVFLIVILLCSRLSLANSCTGRGTVVFFGNGMFNTKKMAGDSLDYLSTQLKQNFSADPSKELKYDVAYKINEESDLIQFFNVASQKGIDRWEDFWLWVSFLKKAPNWFQEAMKLKAVDALKNGTIAFDDVRQHFEDYSRYIREGYNVVLVSHSQGNLYANQTMRKLADYTDASLTGSLSSKRKENPFFPEFFDLFANIQVATPVSATINSSPWSTFFDDIIMDFVRRTPAGALPANLKTRGSNIPPDGDWKGHDFIKAYLRNDESRNKILSDIQTQYNKLKYPIGYFQKAVLLESHWHHSGDDDDLHSPDPDLHFKIVSPSGHLIEGSDEERPNRNEIIHQTFANCYELPIGISKIILTTYTPKSKDEEASYQVWPEGKNKEKPMTIRFKLKPTFASLDWDVGTILVEKGSDKEPLQVKVEIYPQPKPRSKKDRSL